MKATAFTNVPPPNSDQLTSEMAFLCDQRAIRLHILWSFNHSLSEVSGRVCILQIMTSNHLASALHEATTSLAELDFFDLSAQQVPQVLHALSVLRNASDAALARCMRRSEAIAPSIQPPPPPGAQMTWVEQSEVEASSDRAPVADALPSSDVSVFDELSPEVPFVYPSSSELPPTAAPLASCASNQLHPSQLDFQTRPRPHTPTAVNHLSRWPTFPVDSTSLEADRAADPSPTAWIAEATGQAASEVRSAIDTLRILDAEPETHSLYRSGHFTPDQAQALATVVEFAPDCIETALGLAKNAEPAHLLAYADHVREPDDAAVSMPNRLPLASAGVRTGDSVVEAGVDVGSNPSTGAGIGAEIGVGIRTHSIRPCRPLLCPVPSATPALVPLSHIA